VNVARAPVLERIGIGYLRRQPTAARSADRGADRARAHVLTDDEQHDRLTRADVTPARAAARRGPTRPRAPR
jgi:hypothetical protein